MVTMTFPPTNKTLEYTIIKAQIEKETVGD